MCWQATTTKRHPSTGYMSNQYGLGIQLAQLGRDASAAVSTSELLYFFFSCSLFAPISLDTYFSIIMLMLLGCCSSYDHPKEEFGD